MVQKGAEAPVAAESGPGRRQRSRAARRDAILEATRAVIDDAGIAGLTIKSVADRLDCAVGTIYTYFSSKSSLLAAVQVEAIEALGSAYQRVAERVDSDIAAGGLDVETAALARLVAFGRSLVAAGEVYPDEFRLQQMLLDGQADYDAEDLARVAPVAFSVLSRPEQLLREAALLGALDQGDAFNRTLMWVAGVNGVLTLARLKGPGTDVLDPTDLADRMHATLLLGWGATPGAVSTASDLVSMHRITTYLEEGT